MNRREVRQRHPVADVDASSGGTSLAETVVRLSGQPS